VQRLNGGRVSLFGAELEMELYEEGNSVLGPSQRVENDLSLVRGDVELHRAAIDPVHHFRLSERGKTEGS